MAEAMNDFGKTAAVLTKAGTEAEETGCNMIYTRRTKRQITRITEELSGLQKKHLIAAAEYACLKQAGGQDPYHI